MELEIVRIYFLIRISRLYIQIEKYDVIKKKKLKKKCKKERKTTFHRS